MNHQFPLNGDRRHLQEIMRQTAARPAPPPDVENWKMMKCDCGSFEFDSETITLFKFNPLAQQEYAPAQMNRAKCRSCKKYPVVREGKWAFESSPPPIVTE